MSKNKPLNSSSTSFYEEDDEQQLSPLKMRDILAQIKELLDDPDGQGEVNAIFYKTLPEEVNNWYSEQFVDDDEKQLRKCAARKLQSEVFSVVLNLISHDIDSLNKNSRLEDFEQQKDEIAKFVKNLDHYALREKHLIDNFWNDFLKSLQLSIFQVINGKLDPSVLEWGEDVAITARIKQYFDALLSLYVTSSRSPVNSDEEEPLGSSDQNSEDQVMGKKYTELPLSPFEKALIDEQEMIFYLPSDKDSYRKSVDRSIQLGVEVLQEYGFSIKEPKYQCVVGDTSKNNGETNEEGKIVFHYSGSLCRG